MANGYCSTKFGGGATYIFRSTHWQSTASQSRQQAAPLYQNPSTVNNKWEREYDKKITTKSHNKVIQFFSTAPSKIFLQKELYVSSGKLFPVSMPTIGKILLGSQFSQYFLNDIINPSF